MVGLHSQAEADLIAFEERARSSPIVRDCYMLSGEIDFLLKCVAPDLSAFQEFIIHELTAAPNVASVKTSLVIRASKHAAGRARSSWWTRAVGAVRTSDAAPRTQ